MLSSNRQVPPSVLRVVVIDDDELDRFVIRRSFQALGTPVELIEIGDATEAVAAIHDHAPNVTLLDIQMPVMNGFDVLQALAEQTSEQAPLGDVMMLSSSAQPDDRDKAMALGASDYRTKPATLDEYIRLAEDIRETYLT